MGTDREKIVLEPPFTVRVIDNEGVNLEMNRLYTVVGVRPSLLNTEQFGFTLLEVQPEDEAYDSYLSTRFGLQLNVSPN